MMESQLNQSQMEQDSMMRNFSSTEIPLNLTMTMTEHEMEKWQENYFSQAAGPACAMVFGYITTFTKLKHFENANNFQTLGPRLFSGLFFLGAVTAVPLIGSLIETYGRERPLIGTAIFMTLTWVFSLVLSSDTEVWPALIRFILGFIHGAFSLILPIYMVESSEIYKRGTRGCYYIGDGLVGSFVGFAVYKWAKKPWVRTLVNYIILAQLIQIFMGAESPHWEIRKTRDTLSDLRAAFSSLNEWKIVGICVVLMILQEVTVLYPMTEYFHRILSGLINWNIRVGHSQLILLALQFVGVAFACLLVDRVGRRPLLLVSMGLIWMTSLLYGVFLFLVKDEENIEVKGEESSTTSNTTNRKTVVGLWLGLVSTVLFFVGLTLGIRPIAYLTMAELLPMKGKGFMAVLVILMNLIVSYILQVHVEIWKLSEGPKKLCLKIWICSIVAGLGGVFVFFFVPEMNGREFQNFE